MSLLSLVWWWIGLVVLAVTSDGEISRRALEIMSYITLAGFSAVAYAAVLRNSAWFFTLRPVISWTVSILSALALTGGFLFVFQIAFTLYAGW
jgi:hypothetical protein